MDDDKIDTIDHVFKDGKNNGHRANTSKQDGKKKKGSVMKRLRKSFRRLSCVSKSAEDIDEKYTQGKRPHEKQSVRNDVRLTQQPHEVQINSSDNQQLSQRQQEITKHQQEEQQRQGGFHRGQQEGQQCLPPLGSQEDLYDHSSYRGNKQVTENHSKLMARNEGRYDDVIQKPLSLEQQRNHQGFIRQDKERKDNIFRETVSAQTCQPHALSFAHDQRSYSPVYPNDGNKSTIYEQTNSINSTGHARLGYNQQWQPSKNHSNLKIYLQTPESGPRYTTTQTDFENEYDFTHKRRGMAVIIIMKSFENNMQPARPLSENDKKRMVKLFSDLGFEIEVIEDAKSQELIDKLKAIRERMAMPDYDCDCFACVVSSHGEEIPSSRIHEIENVKLREHAIATFNGYVLLRTIIELFDDGAELENKKLFKSLKGKPKLFFIQACRSIFGKSNEECIDPGISVEFCFGSPLRNNQLTSQMERPCSEEKPDESNFAVTSSSVKELEPIASDDLKINPQNATNLCSLPETGDLGKKGDKSLSNLEGSADESYKMLDENSSKKAESHMDGKHEFDPTTNTYRIVQDPTSRFPVYLQTGRTQHSLSQNYMQTNNPKQEYGMACNYGSQYSTWSSHQQYNSECKPTHLSSHNTSQSVLPPNYIKPNREPNRELNSKLEDTLKFMDEVCSSPVGEPITIPSSSIKSSETQTYERQQEKVEYCEIPCGNDCLVMYTAPSGFIGWTTGDKDNVSIYDIAGWIPYCLYNILNSVWVNKTILEVLTESNHLMVQKLEAQYNNRIYKSVGQIDHRLIKDVIFRPKK